MIVPNLTKQGTITAVDRSDPAHPRTIQLKVGKRLGFGMKGAVYVIEEITGDSPALAPFKGKPVQFVLKTSHQGRWFGSFQGKFQRILEEERRVYESLLQSLSAMEKDPWYPENPNWASGTLPIAPILMDIETDWGHGLVKLMLPGKSVQAIAAEYKRGELSKAEIDSMTKSLRDWYRTSQAASNHAMITPIETGVPRPITSLDINPENMVYVEDPFYLDLLGVKNGQPTFAAYELGEPALTTYRHEELSEEQYRQMWINFVRGIQ